MRNSQLVHPTDEADRRALRAVEVHLGRDLLAREREPAHQVCYVDAHHPRDALERGIWGARCSACWANLLKTASPVGQAARAWVKHFGDSGVPDINTDQRALFAELYKSHGGLACGYLSALIGRTAIGEYHALIRDMKL